MTKAAAIQKFFSSFGMEAYTTASVPDDAVFPYLTYELAVSAWEEGEVALTVDLWFHTESEAIPNRKAEELSAAIGQGGAMLRCDGGYVWLKRGSPWCQSIRDEADRSIKRRYINVTAEYFTLN